MALAAKAFNLLVSIFLGIFDSTNNFPMFLYPFGFNKNELNVIGLIPVSRTSLIFLSSIPPEYAMGKSPLNFDAKISATFIDT